jgi:hypothetical protein
MSTERETLATDFANARSHGLIDLKFFVMIDGNTTVDGLRAAAHKAECAIRDGHVVDFMVDDEGMVASSLDGLLYN